MSIQRWCHSSSVPGSTKNSSSICSNSRVRKMKLPGVISLRNALPIWAIPNGIFLRLTCWMIGKSTKIPWAVSGRSQTTAEASSTGPMKVLNIRLKLRGSVNGPLPQLGHFSLALGGGAAVLGLERLDQVVLAEALVAVGALDQRVGERLQVPGGLPDPRGHDDGRVLADHVVAQLHDRAPPGPLDVVLQLDPERTVVVARADPAVDLARLEGEAAAFGQVDDRVHRVAGH